MSQIYLFRRAVSISACAALLLGLGCLSSCTKTGNSGGLTQARDDEIEPNGPATWQLVTGDDIDDDRRQWDQVYNKTEYVFGKEPSHFLKENVGRLPKGRVLDIATGEGRNAVFMASKGFTVEAVDISDVALKKARRLARESRVKISTIQADLNTYAIKPDSYDVILNIDFLQRALIPKIKRGLKRGGIIVYENYTVKQLDNTKGKALQRNFLLEEGELPKLFKDFRIILYKETNDGKDARASLLAQKP